ncbi:MAG: GIY-YIG nuclease family protein [Dehalococcoidales bacterium]|nr:GIY-YIG nuclease family protein [Dehalococcoidales bacterium]
MQTSQYYVYILANKTNVALYIGVTNDLRRRVYEHKNKFVNGFAEKYDIDKLVYYEVFGDPENAILREKKLKGGSRAKKNRLVESMNPQWRDLYDEL